MKEIIKYIEEKLVEVNKEYLSAFNKLNDKTQALSLIDKLEYTTKLNYYAGQKIALESVLMKIKSKEEKC